MSPIYSIAIAAAIFSAIISLVATWIVIKFARKIGIVDDPKKNKHPKVIHKKPTPRGGGLAIFIAIALASVVFLPLDKHLIGILLGATILTVTGILDDKYNLNPYLRIAIQAVAALMPIISGIGFAFTTNPLTGGVIDFSHPQINFYLLGEQRSIWVLSDIFALIWIISLMNFLNMGAKGLPGQLTGVTSVAAITIAILSLRFSADITQWPVTILASIVAGSFLGFLPWHIWPQRIMPSFSGSNLAGYTLGVLSILSTAKIGTLVIVLALPIIDTLYTIVRRLIEKKSPVWGDRGHLHHRLLDSGWSQSKVTVFYWGITILMGAVALNLSSTNKLYTIIGTIILVGGLIAWLSYRSK